MLYPADVTPPSPRRGELAIRVSLPLLVAAWLVGTAGLFAGAALTTAPFFGERAGLTDITRADRLLYASMAVAVVVPLLGLALGLWVRRRLAVWVFAVVLILGGAYTATVGLRLHQERPERHPSHRVVCQEYSGGDTHCPGG